MAARSKDRANKVIAEVKGQIPNAAIRFIELDLADFASIKKVADEVIKSTDRLDILMNNAGTGQPPGLTKDGYEINFGTNHMGHALLTKLLLPVLQRTAKEQGEARIVNLSSSAHTWTPKGGICFEECKTDMRRTNTLTRYGQSKLANLLFTKGLAKHYPDIKSMAVHPGSTNTEISQGPIAKWPPWLRIPANILAGLLMATAAEGALTQLFAATGEDVKSGTYYVPVAKENAASAHARDEKLIDALWEYTQKELESAGY